MAIVQNGLIGRASGQYGGAVFYTNGGQNVIRSKPVQVAPSNTPRQVAQRNAMATMVAMFSMFASIVRIGFRNRIAKLSAYNAFVKKNLGLIFDFTDPENVVVDCNVLSLSSGSLTQTPVTVAVVGNVCTATWPTATSAPDQAATDMFSVAVVEENGSIGEIVVAGIARSAGTGSKTIADFATKYPSAVFLAFSYSAVSSLVSETAVCAVS